VVFVKIVEFYAIFDVYSSASMSFTIWMICNIMLHYVTNIEQVSWYMKIVFIFEVRF